MLFLYFLFLYYFIFFIFVSLSSFTISVNTTFKVCITRLFFFQLELSICKIIKNYVRNMIYIYTEYVRMKKEKRMVPTGIEPAIFCV